MYNKRTTGDTAPGGQVERPDYDTRSMRGKTSIMDIDQRHIACGWEIPSEGYCDQPYVVVNNDGSWTCCMTTGSGHEGATGQHVVSLVSRDRGRSWEGPFDIEPADGPEASWVMPLRVPETGRIYAFYTYNAANQRSVKNVDGRAIARVDSLGTHAYRYSDDGGRSWSAERYEIPMRLFECDRANTCGGEVQFFWGVGKPFVHKDMAYVCVSKVGGFGEGFFAQNEGVLFRSDNLLHEHDPAKHLWQTLPDGDIGLRTPPGGGPIAGEFNATPMNDGSLMGTFRTIAGWSCQAYSRDVGRHWDVDWMHYQPGGRRVKNPRSANFVRRFSNGRYLYWFCFNGGEVLGSHPAVGSWAGYANRNPIWLCGGVERAGIIHWSQPELILYNDDLSRGMSYPDFIEDDGRIFITETQKTIARVHELDPALLEAMWNQLDNQQVARTGLLLELDAAACAATDSVAMPELPALHDRGGEQQGSALMVESRRGFALELCLCFDDLEPWQVVFDSRGPEGRGLLVQLTDSGTLKLTIISRAWGTPGARVGNGIVESAGECDIGLLQPGCEHQVLFNVDGGPKLITVMVDGELCDGGAERQFGWSRFHPALMHPNGADEARLAPGLHGSLLGLRLYDRHLLTSEGVGNWRAARQALCT